MNLPPVFLHCISLFLNSLIKPQGVTRKKSGFIIAKKHHTALDIGDELNMISKKNKDLVVVADKNRQRAIKKIIEKIILKQLF